MTEKLILPEQPFVIIPGLEDPDNLLRITEREALSSLMKDETRGVCMMNGSIIPLVHLCSEAIQLNVPIHGIASKMVMIAPTKDPEGDIVLTPNKNIAEPNITVIEDIADKLDVLKALLRKFPCKYIKLFAPVSKESTPKFHPDGLISAEVFAFTTVADKWIAGSCGMDEGV